MQPLKEMFESHPLGRPTQEQRREQVLSAFRAHVNDDSYHQWYLSLYRFASNRPLLYMRQRTIESALSLYNLHPNEVIEALENFSSSLSHAIFSLLRPGTSWGKEDPLSLTTPTDILEFESVWHPEYQRYCEHILNFLIRPALYILGKNRGKKYQHLQLPNGVDILQKNGLDLLALGHSQIVRNAISHGDIAFGLYEVAYQGDKKWLRLSPPQFSQLFDDLVDTCHSMLVALLLFVCQNRSAVESYGLDKLPLGLRYLLIDGLTTHTSLSILGMAESEATLGRNQLNMNCWTVFRSRTNQFYEALRTSYFSYICGGELYDRFNIGFDVGALATPSVIINGNRLGRAIENKESLEDCAKELVEIDMLWFEVHPLERKIAQWRAIGRELLPKTRQTIIDDWRASGIDWLVPRYTIRHWKPNIAGDWRRLEADIIIHSKEDMTAERLVRIVKHAVQALQTTLLRGGDLRGSKGLPLWPHYIWVRAYSEDKRLRQLKSMTWKDKEFLLSAEWFTAWRNLGPITVKKPDVVHDKVRIQFNPNLGIAL